MTLIPISSGRIPNSLMASQAANNINTLEDQLNQVEQEIETGQQLTTPGQNPTATAIVLPLQQQLAAQTQYQSEPHHRSIVLAKHRYGAADRLDRRSARPIRSF